MREHYDDGWTCEQCEQVFPDTTEPAYVVICPDDGLAYCWCEECRGERYFASFSSPEEEEEV